MTRLLLLHTGGTIGMLDGPRGLAPAAGALAETIARLPRLADPARPRGPVTFTTPPIDGSGRRIEYDLVELDPLLDSANLELAHWARFATEIADRYDAYDGFVVLHGTDTMAYTASALSFVLVGLAKPVVLTGAQLPLVRLRTDAHDNLLGALLVAATAGVPEVGLYFHHALYRGNRATKIDATRLGAFDSPALPPLVEIGTGMRTRADLLLPPSTRPFAPAATLSPHVASLRVYPGITADVLANFLRPPLDGLVLETYGTGNFPETRGELVRVLRDATDRGVVILNVSQCLRGSVRAEYAAGRALGEAGVIGGADLTPEAALTKLAWLLGQGLARERVRELAGSPLAGEMTPTPEAA